MFFHRTECCSFVHNSTPYIHPRPDLKNWPRQFRMEHWVGSSSDLRNTKLRDNWARVQCLLPEADRWANLTIFFFKSVAAGRWNLHTEHTRGVLNKLKFSEFSEFVKCVISNSLSHVLLYRGFYFTAALTNWYASVSREIIQHFFAFSPC